MNTIVSFKKKPQQNDYNGMKIHYAKSWETVKARARQDFVSSGTGRLADGFIEYFEPIFFDCVHSLPVPYITDDWRREDVRFDEIHKAIENLTNMAWAKHAQLIERIYLLELAKYARQQLFPDD